MSGFTDEIRRFLASQRIWESEVFDASRLSPHLYKYYMELEGKLFAIVLRPCYQGHHLRSRSGHCIQCDTRRIAFTKRHYQEAYVYVAGSLAERVVKIGSTGAPWDKGSYLNKIGYGDIIDWKILYYAKTLNAGKVEFEAHRQLSAYAAPRKYFREGWETDCREIFRCGYSAARNALDAALPNQTTAAFEHRQASSLYDFGSSWHPEMVLPVREKSDASSPAFGQLLFNPTFLKKVEELELSLRSANCLKNDKIVFLGDLVQKTEAEMLRTPNFGRKSLNEIKEILVRIGLRLGTDIPGWPPHNIEELAKQYGEGHSLGSKSDASLVAPEKPPFNPAFLKKVDELELSVRTANCLRNDNIVFIGDLVQKTEAEMLRTPNFGRKSLNEIKEVLVQIGLHLGMDIRGWPPNNIEELAKRFEDHY